MIEFVRACVLSGRRREIVYRGNQHGKRHPSLQSDRRRKPNILLLFLIFDDVSLYDWRSRRRSSPAPLFALRALSSLIRQLVRWTTPLHWNPAVLVVVREIGAWLCAHHRMIPTTTAHTSSAANTIQPHVNVMASDLNTESQRPSLPLPLFCRQQPMCPRIGARPHCTVKPLEREKRNKKNVYSSMPSERRNPRRLSRLGRAGVTQTGSASGHRRGQAAAWQGRLEQCRARTVRAAAPREAAARD